MPNNYFGGSIFGGAIRSFRAQSGLHPFRAMRHYFVGRAKMKTVLLLDDESMILKLLGSVLSGHYNVIGVETAEQALRSFIEHHRVVDLLVADLSLAKSSGILVALLLRSVIPGLPIILTSGYPVNSWCERDAADLVRLGPRSVAIIEKPFLSQTLLKAVRDLTREPQTELARTA